MNPNWRYGRHPGFNAAGFVILPSDAGSEWTVVRAGAADRGFLGEMLYEAAFWRPGGVRPALEQALCRPDLAKWLDGWGQRGGDAGVIALGDGEAPVGAAWYRHWTDGNHSFGYVSETVPELAIGVVEAFRGRGVGKALLTALFLEASRNRIEQLSLSVAK